MRRYCLLLWSGGDCRRRLPKERRRRQHRTRVWAGRSDRSTGGAGSRRPHPRDSDRRRRPRQAGRSRSRGSTPATSIWRCGARRQNGSRPRRRCGFLQAGSRPEDMRQAEAQAAAAAATSSAAEAELASAEADLQRFEGCSRAIPVRRSSEMMRRPTRRGERSRGVGAARGSCGRGRRGPAARPAPGREEIDAARARVAGRRCADRVARKAEGGRHRACADRRRRQRAAAGSG